MRTVSMTHVNEEKVLTENEAILLFYTTLLQVCCWVGSYQSQFDC